MEDSGVSHEGGEEGVRVDVTGGVLDEVGLGNRPCQCAEAVRGAVADGDDR